MNYDKENQSVSSRDFFAFNPDTEYIGRKFCFYDEIDSTNAEAKRNSHMPHGTVFFANKQTAGRGRLGRSWISNDDNITFSILLKPELRPEDVFLITLIIGLAVKNVVKGSAIKWPNDIVLGTKKVCGVLTEMGTENGKVSYVVAGVGINLNTEVFDDSISNIATSVYLETGIKTSRQEFLNKLLVEIEKWYDHFIKYGFKSCVEDYKKSCITLGRQVLIKSPEGDFVSKAVDVTENGELVVDTEDGTKKILTGEISVRGLFGYV